MFKMSKCSLLLISLFALTSCGKDAEVPFNSNYNTEDNEYLYVISGGCYGGGVAVNAGGSATIARYFRATGAFDRLMVDYASNNNGDIPVAVINKDDTSLYVVIENAGGRRIEVLDKETFESTVYLTNTTALTGVIRAALKLNDNSILVSKSTAIEKFSASKARVQMGANAYVQAPAAPCATTATLISAMGILPNGNIVYTHAAASPNNKIGVVSGTGYAAAPNCLATHAAPATTAMPSALLVHSSGKLLVAYGSTTAGSNFIYSYNVDATTSAISNPVLAYQDIANINGPSAMIEDPETGEIYVANGISTFNNVQKFRLDATDGTLELVDPIPFITASLFTRCISSMAVGN